MSMKRTCAGPGDSEAEAWPVPTGAVPMGRGTCSRLKSVLGRPVGIVPGSMSRGSACSGTGGGATPSSLAGMAGAARRTAGGAAGLRMTSISLGGGPVRMTVGGSTALARESRIPDPARTR